MGIISLAGYYQLQETYHSEEFHDYRILYNGLPIGALGLRIYEKIFIRNIRIEPQYRRKGHAKAVVDSILTYYQKPILLCIAMESESAIQFWNTYLANKDGVTNPKGNIYQIDTVISN